MMGKEANHGEVREESKRFDELEEMLKDGAEELQAFMSCFLNEEQETDDELEAIEGIMIEELIDVMREESIIGVKEMGKLDEEVLLRACELKGAKGDLELEATLVCTKWQNEISKTNWHPFRITIIDGEAKVIFQFCCLIVLLYPHVVDIEKLIALKEEWRIEAYNAVIRAVLEMNKYNPSARRPVPQMWNFRDDREASVSEAIGLVMKDMKT
ncbi:hypothetical protein PR202_gb00285 [Eleusine coracana subsp. coracana]|uniref:Factor of DNA methylation 1-5/IDN2 domain-containing protein n=1 Tax=Eleusine coracana subsp. coracana TaxID=191504 RepID=A0AAV5DT15_ELECO|nr:hypothetical protein PR202_gb00285 [Eleusine coracana subsp. coracana]